MQRESSLLILEHPKREPRKFGPIFGLFVGLPLLAIAAVVSVPVTFVGFRVHEYKRKRFGRRMERIGRTIPFEEFQKVVQADTGTVIGEWRGQFKGPVRLWWTPEDVYALAPFPCVDHFTMSRDSAFRPFLDWFYQRYLSLNEGKAMFAVATSKQLRILNADIKNARRIEVPTASDECW